MVNFVIPVLQSKTALCRLFSGRAYDSDMICRVVRKVRILHYGDATDCRLKLVELGNYHSSKGSVFEMDSDKGGRLENFHWSGSFTSLFVDKYNDFVLIDGTHKTNIYDISLIVTTTVDSLGILVPVGFLLTPSENSDSIEDHLDYLKIGGIHSHGLHAISACSIMTDEDSALVKVASLFFRLQSLPLFIFYFYVDTLYGVYVLISHLLSKML